MSDRKVPLVFSPYVVMACVLAMYALKVIAKIAIGTFINSPMVTGDGYHNTADILEAVAVITVITLSRRPADGTYPFGRKNAESIFELGVGIGLVVMAFQVGLRSLAGALQYVPDLKASVEQIVPLPAFEPLRMGPEYFWWVVGVMAVSVLLSVLVSAYEIAAGKVNGHKSLIADGQETRSDSIIELVILVGILGEYQFNAPWIEYPFGLCVAFLLMRTGREIVVRGWRALLQRSIGQEHETAIGDIVRTTYGVVDLGEIKTFMIGPMAVCIMKIVTRCSAETDLDIKTAIVARIQPYMEARGFEKWDYYVRFEKPQPDRHRICYCVVIEQGIAVVALGMRTATHFRVCDIEDDAVVRWKDVPVPKSTADAVGFLQGKRVRQLWALCEESDIVERLAGTGVSYENSALLMVNFSGATHVCTGKNE